MNLERILVKQAAMFLPGIPIIKYSGKSELNYAVLQDELEDINPRVILIESDAGNRDKKFSLIVGNKYRDKIDFKKVFTTHQGIIFNGSHIIYANDDAMMQSVGLALMKLSKIE